MERKKHVADFFGFFIIYIIIQNFCLTSLQLSRVLANLKIGRSAKKLANLPKNRRQLPTSWGNLSDHGSDYLPTQGFFSALPKIDSCTQVAGKFVKSLEYLWKVYICNLLFSPFSMDLTTFPTSKTICQFRGPWQGLIFPRRIKSRGEYFYIPYFI